MAPGLKTFVQRWLVNTVGVLVAAKVVHGIEFDSFGTLLAASLLLGILNAFLRPIMLLLSLPLLIFSLGLFTLVINALLLYLVGLIVKSFQVASFRAAFWGALIISIVSMIANVLFGTSRIKVTTSKKPPGPPSDSGNGPVIDV